MSNVPIQGPYFRERDNITLQSSASVYSKIKFFR